MRKRILYIEDDAETMALVQQFLETRLPGVMVDVCTTDAGAEAHLNASCYDLIISDYCLASGVATGAVIAGKVLARDPGQPFLLISEYIGEDVKAEARHVGLELHGKFSTVTPDEFLSRVRELLDQRPCVEPVAITEPVDASSSKRDSAIDRDCDQPANARASSDSAIVPAGSSSLAMAAGTTRQERRVGQVPRSPIRLLSQHVTSALATIGHR